MVLLDGRVSQHSCQYHSVSYRTALRSRTAGRGWIYLFEKEGVPHRPQMTAPDFNSSRKYILAFAVAHSYFTTNPLGTRPFPASVLHGITGQVTLPPSLPSNEVYKRSPPGPWGERASHDTNGVLQKCLDRTFRRRVSPCSQCLREPVSAGAGYCQAVCHPPGILAFLAAKNGL